MFGFAFVFFHAGIVNIIQYGGLAFSRNDPFHFQTGKDPVVNVIGQVGLAVSVIRPGCFQKQPAAWAIS